MSNTVCSPRPQLYQCSFIRYVDFHKVNIAKTSKTACTSNHSKTVYHFSKSVLEQFDCQSQLPSTTIPAQRWALHPVT